MRTPKVSVVMTVYNAQDYVGRAIKSILDQTFDDFEFIIIDDGSTDRSLSVIKSFTDKRILLKSRPNKGVPASSNEGIALARGSYIARQDADDISSKNRLQKQVEFLDSHTDIDLLGTNYTAVDAKGQIVFVTNMFTRPDDLRLAIVFWNQFGHGSTMMRSSILKKVGGYREISIVHDYDLWFRISRVGKMANLKDCLYIWRYHGKSLSNSNFDNTTHQLISVYEEAFDYFRLNRKDYSFLTLHPLSARNIFGYFSNKSRIYRKMAVMYSRNGLRRYSILPLLIAIVLAPWAKQNYLFFVISIFKPEKIKQLPYD